ncbi:MAG: ATP-binding cassette domain-containing protein [Phycisphaerae bacterium]|nr:ATP-binding cassette domain-containing protein [Phycisphaerae bacterium]
MADMPLLDARDLSASAAGVTLITGLDLQVATGELVALTGPSGCGKTTLLRALAGLIDLAGGEVYFRGAARGAAGWPRFRRQVVLVQQKPALLDDSVEANLRRPFEYGVAEQSFSKEAAVETLGNFGLTSSFMAQNARALSVGEQQRVCLARALLIQPAMLLLDEPTSALDSRARDMVEALLGRVTREHGLAALVVLHDEHQAQRLCQRTVDLRPHLAPRPHTADAATPGVAR